MACKSTSDFPSGNTNLNIGFWNVGSVKEPDKTRSSIADIQEVLTAEYKEISKEVETFIENEKCPRAEDLKNLIEENNKQWQKGMNKIDEAKDIQNTEDLEKKMDNLTKCSEKFQVVEDLGKKEQKYEQLLTNHADAIAAIKNSKCYCRIIKVENERPALIERHMRRKDCDILVCSEAKRPLNVERLCFNKKELNEGYGWGKLHRYDAFWVGTPQKSFNQEGITFPQQHAINGVLLVFKPDLKQKIVGKPRTFSCWEFNSEDVSTNIAKLTTNISHLTFKDSKSSLNDYLTQFKTDWMNRLRKSFYSWIMDLETRMLHVKLELTCGLVNIFGCYVPTNDGTHEKERDAVIFFLKLSEIVYTIGAACVGRKEFVVVCGDMNAKYKDVAEQTNPMPPSPTTAKTKQNGKNSHKKLTAKQKTRKEIFGDFCKEHELEVLEFKEGSDPTHQAGDKASDAHLDYLACGWIGNSTQNDEYKFESLPVEVVDYALPSLKKIKPNKQSPNQKAGGPGNDVNLSAVDKNGAEKQTQGNENTDGKKNVQSFTVFVWLLSNGSQRTTMLKNLHKL